MPEITPPSMVQGNRADRKQGALVGLHYHRFQSDFWYVPNGRAMVVLHDLRASSPTDGQTLVLEIGEHDHRGVYIPPGIAHGFYALTDMTITYQRHQSSDQTRDAQSPFAGTSPPHRTREAERGPGHGPSSPRG